MYTEKMPWFSPIISERDFYIWVTVWRHICTHRAHTFHTVAAVVTTVAVAADATTVIAF